MAKGSREWLEAVALKAGVDPECAQKVLDAKGIRPSPVIASPRRLTILRITFSGEKVGVPDAGPFDFEWNDLGSGLWAMVTEANLKGKSSVIEIVRWMLRGRPSDRLQDVKDWLHFCTLRFSIDEIVYEVRSAMREVVTGSFVKISQEGGEIVLASFGGESEFEAVMSGFFLREFGLDTITRWYGGAEEDGGKAVVHGWPSLSGALFIGTDYSMLLGDMPPASGLITPLLQMYLGLPWVSTLTAAKSTEQAIKRDQEAKARRLKAGEAARKKRADFLRAELENKRKQLTETPSDEDVRAELAQLQMEFRAEKKAERAIEARIEMEVTALEQAEAAYAEDRRELQAHIDGEAAGAVFRVLDPSFCPRCETAVTQERKTREKETHSCSICGEHIEGDEDADTEKANLETRVSASKAARAKTRQNLKKVQEAQAITRDHIDVMNTRISFLTDKLATFGERRLLETEIAVLEGRLSEASIDAEPEEVSTEEGAVVKAAVAETEKRVKATQTGLLKEVSEQLVRYAQRFGMVNLNTAELRGNGHLPLVKGGKSMGYGQCTDGEKLRLKVAAVLAMIRIAEAKGVGRHPGLLLIDSPGAHEVARKDLDNLISGLEEASKEFKHLQVFVGAISSPSITAHIPAERMLYAKGDAPLW